MSKVEAKASRIRRSAGDARREILEAAERRLVACGPDAVRVQTIARDVGITDAAVHYHFGNREGLYEALIRYAGGRLKDQLTAVAAGWNPGSLDMHELVELLESTYDRLGYARLTAWMRLAGWQPRGAGMLRHYAQALHAARASRAAAAGAPEPRAEDTRFVLALVNLVAWAEALIGDSTRRMVDLPRDRASARRFMDWFASLLSEHALSTEG